MRNALGLLAAFLLLAFAVPATGMAASGIIIGPNDISAATASPTNLAFPATIAQLGSGYAAAQPGTITKWRLNSPSGGGHAKLVVLHRAGCDYQVVGESAPVTLTAGINDVSTSVHINAGDYIGVILDTLTPIYYDTSTSGSYYAADVPAVGESATFAPAGALYLFNALMTPDGSAPDPEPNATPQPADQPVVMNAQVTTTDGERTASPAAGPLSAGAAFGLTGANMNLAESVYFNNVPARTWWIDGFEKLTVVVPAGLPEGPVQVRVGGVAGVTEDTPSTTVFITRDRQIAPVVQASQAPVGRNAGTSKQARKAKTAKRNAKTKQNRTVARLADGGVHGAC